MQAFFELFPNHVLLVYIPVFKFFIDQKIHLHHNGAAYLVNPQIIVFDVVLFFDCFDMVFDGLLQGQVDRPHADNLFKGGNNLLDYSDKSEQNENDQHGWINVGQYGIVGKNGQHQRERVASQSEQALAQGDFPLHQLGFHKGGVGFFCTAPHLFNNDHQSKGVEQKIQDDASDRKSVV